MVGGILHGLRWLGAASATGQSAPTHGPRQCRAGNTSRATRSDFRSAIFATSPWGPTGLAKVCRIADEKSLLDRDSKNRNGRMPLVNPDMVVRSVGAEDEGVPITAPAPVAPIKQNRLGGADLPVFNGPPDIATGSKRGPRFPSGANVARRADGQSSTNEALLGAFTSASIAARAASAGRSAVAPRQSKGGCACVHEEERIYSRSADPKKNRG